MTRHFPRILNAPTCLAGVALIWLSSCTPYKHYAYQTKEAPACTALVEMLDRAVASERVRDVQSVRVDGFPMLRINRFLASFSEELTDEQRFDFWLLQAEGLALEGWSVEWVNLSEKEKSDVSSFSRLKFGTDAAVALQQCVNRTHGFRLKHRETILQRLKVPDNYQSWKRFLGIYPITAWPFLAGVHHWHKEARSAFETPVSENALALTYIPEASTPGWTGMGSNWLSKSRKNPLSIPLPDQKIVSKLFAMYAPAIAIVAPSESDHLGKINWSDGKIMVNPDSAVAYTLLSHTRFEHHTLLQLNYIFWFPSRPKSSAFDLLGGHLDGLIWRVTLDTDGQPLLYDSIHPCGCYHMFFPSDRLTPLVNPLGYEEGALIPQRITNLPEDKHPMLLLESGTHYLIRIKPYTKKKNATAYYLLPYTKLRQLNKNGHSRSMFGEDGLVKGSERGERFFFWPMGIASPGAMRQWGHHATEFVGKRHFDDPWLIQRYFMRVAGSK